VTDDLDELDRAIVTQLQEDGRRSFREIGRSLRIPESTVRSRVKRLQTVGILNIVAYVDPMQLGNYTLSLLLVKIEPEFHGQVVEKLMGRPEVTYLSTALSGTADLLVEFISADDQQRWDFMNLVVRALPGVDEVEILPIVRTHKFMYRLFPER
jgi:Lrp/AsnC family transcriptional regulator for asnA, asnC and gidA